MGNCLKCRNGDSSVGAHSPEVSRRYQDSRVGRFAPYLDNDPILHPTPGISRPMSQLTEEEQVKIATRMGLISTLPLFIFDEGKREKLTECIICMCEYEEGDELRYLPCLHTYHRVCIDDWLMRALICPSCLEELRPASPDLVTHSLCNTQDPFSVATPPLSASSPRPSHQRRDDVEVVQQTADNNSTSVGDINGNSNRMNLPGYQPIGLDPPAALRVAIGPFLPVLNPHSGEGILAHEKIEDHKTVPMEKVHNDILDSIMIDFVTVNESTFPSDYGTPSVVSTRHRSGSSIPVFVDRRRRPQSQRNDIPQHPSPRTTAAALQDTSVTRRYSSDHSVDDVDSTNGVLSFAPCNVDGDSSQCTTHQ